MRVLHVLPSPIVGGAEIATRRLVEAVRPFGVESSALLLRPTRELCAYFDQTGIPVMEALDPPEPSLARHAGAFLKASRRLARLFSPYDLVHCADTKAAYSVAVAARLAGRPVLCHVRNREPRIAHRDRLFIGAAHHFAFVSEQTRQLFALRLPDRRASVLYDGVDISPAASPQARAQIAAQVRAGFQLEADAVLVAMFARAHPAKDFFTVVRAAAQLSERYPRLRFLMVGDNAQDAGHLEHFRRIEQAARAAGVLDRFIFTGFRRDTANLMAAADICLHCTHVEGFPLVVIEAMAAGRPCVATAVDGIPEAITPGVSGLLHAHEDAAGLAAALASLLDDPARAERLGAAARREAQARFSTQRFANDAFALYQRLVGPAAGAPRVQAPGAPIAEGTRPLRTL